MFNGVLFYIKKIWDFWDLSDAVFAFKSIYDFEPKKIMILLPFDNTTNYYNYRYIKNYIKYFENEGYYVCIINNMCQKVVIYDKSI